MRASDFSRLYQDLLGVRFVDGGRDPATGLDCLGAARVYLSRVRQHVPDGAFPTHQPDASAAAALAWVDQDCSTWWDRIGDTPRAAMLHGDVVFTIGAKEPCRPHVSVLVYPAVPKLLLSAAPGRGVFTLPLDRCLRAAMLIGVYRLRYEAAPHGRTQAA